MEEEKYFLQSFFKERYSTANVFPFSGHPAYQNYAKWNVNVMVSLCIKKELHTHTY